MKFSSNRIGAALVLSLIVLLTAAAARPSRAVRGRVLSANGEALNGAVVQIKNTQTLRIRSYITRKDGRYRLFGLNPDADYEIFARYRGRSSSTKTISRFDSSQTVELDLTIE